MEETAFVFVVPNWIVLVLLLCLTVSLLTDILRGVLHILHRREDRKMQRLIAAFAEDAKARGDRK